MKLDKDFETFKIPNDFMIRNIEQDKPSCFNGKVSVRRYRIRIEEIDEPIEDIQARLIKLWENTTNHHHRQPLIAEAKKYGLDFRKM